MITIDALSVNNLNEVADGRQKGEVSNMKGCCDTFESTFKVQWNQMKTLPATRPLDQDVPKPILLQVFRKMYRKRVS